MSPAAAEIRAAADRLRTLADAATPGPWRLDETSDEEGFDAVAVLREDWDVVAWEGAGNYARRHANTSYIAAMSPAVGRAVVDLLDTVADSTELGDCPTRVVGAALIAARRISTPAVADEAVGDA